MIPSTAVVVEGEHMAYTYCFVCKQLWVGIGAHLHSFAESHTRLGSGKESEA